MIMKFGRHFRRPGHTCPQCGYIEWVSGFEDGYEGFISQEEKADFMTFRRNGGNIAEWNLRYSAIDPKKTNP